MRHEITRSHPITLIGVGDDGPRSLGEEARVAVAEADLLCGGARHLSAFDAPGERLPITKDLAGLVARIEEAREEGRCVVVLASGDPLFYGIGSVLSERFGPDALRVLPAVSSIQLAFARLGLPWQDAAVLSAHGRPLAPLLGRAMASARFAVLTDGVNTPARVAAALLDGGMEDAAAAVCEHLGGEHERVTRGTLSAIAAQAHAPLNVLVVMRDPAAVRWGYPLLGVPDDRYAHPRGQITKAEVRTVSVARLGMERAIVVWDIGAGSGSVSIEAASLRLDAAVYAVEREPAQLAFLRNNVRRFTAGNVIIVAGEAPAALEPLPDPDAVFIGGSGGRLTAVLEASLRRVTPGGRVVLNLVSLDHLQTARRTFLTQGWAVDVAQISVARSASIANTVRLAALNPVFVVSGERA